MLECARPSAAALHAIHPVLRVSPQVHDCNDEDFLGSDTVKNGKWKLPNKSPANIASHCSACVGKGGNAVNRLLQVPQKPTPKIAGLRFVVALRLPFRFRPD